jgi:hypothetical protein
MSKTKRALSEDIDLTDSSDSGFYGEDAPTLDDMFINGLMSNIRALEGMHLDDYLPELIECKHRLEKLIVEAERSPF